MSASVLSTRVFWRALLERAGRQAAQTVLPLIAVIGVSGGGLNIEPIALATTVAVAVTLLKGLAGISAGAGESLGWHLLDRAVPAAAGVLIGAVPVDLADLAHIDAKNLTLAALAAAATAVISFYVTPPSGIDAQVVTDVAPTDEALDNI